MRTRATGPVTPPGGAPRRPPHLASRRPRGRPNPPPPHRDTARAPRTSARKGARNYYEVIDGVRMDRKVLDDFRESVNDDGVIDLDEAHTSCRTS